MAHFYGTIEGKGGTAATRCGSKVSGLEAYVLSWGGGVYVEFWHDSHAEVDMVKVEGRQHPGAVAKGKAHPKPPRVLYEGPVDGLWKGPER